MGMYLGDMWYQQARTLLERKGSKSTIGNAGEGETSLDHKILQDSDSEAPAIFYRRNGFGVDISLYLTATSLGKSRLLQSRDKEFSINTRRSSLLLQSSCTKNKLSKPLGGPSISRIIWRYWYGTTYGFEFDSAKCSRDKPHQVTIA